MLYLRYKPIVVFNDLALVIEKKGLINIKKSILKLVAKRFCCYYCHREKALLY